MWHSKGHAETLRMIANTKAVAFYRGKLADQIDASSKKYNGFLRKKDLETFKPEWGEPLSVNYRGYDAWELPPNGQGLIALNALNILKHFEPNAQKSLKGYHRSIEAMKLAFADGQKYITDSKEMKVNPSHSIIPGFLTKDNQAVAAFGVMGGPIQPQGHLQVMQYILDDHLNSQAALDAPRWQWVQDKTVLVETDFPKHQAESLSRLGHEIKVELASGTFGRGQMIWRDQETGTYFGGTDSRTSRWNDFFLLINARQ